MVLNKCLAFNLIIISSFEKTWHICNSGNEAWPAGCYAKCSDGELGGTTAVIVPCLMPGEGMHLTVKMTGPSVPGIYQSKWRLCTSNGSYFGGKWNLHYATSLIFC